MKKNMASVTGITLLIFACAITFSGCGNGNAEVTIQKESPKKIALAQAPQEETQKPEVAVAPKPKAPAEKLEINERTMIADFESGDKPNNLNGDFGAWDKDPNDTTMYSRISFSPEDAYEGSDYSLRLDYDVDSPNPAYNGFWMKLETFDASAYKGISISIRGDAITGFTPRIKLELKNAKGQVGKYYLPGITSSWREVAIPFEKFKGLKDFTDMTEFVVVFEDTVSNPKVGTIYIDNIAFVK